MGVEGQRERSGEEICGLIILKIENTQRHCDAVIGFDKCEFVCVDWCSPVQGEQRGLHLYGEVEIM